MQQKLTHGGDWAGFEAEYGRPPLDFSANVSPLGVPWAVRRAYTLPALQGNRAMTKKIMRFWFKSFRAVLTAVRTTPAF